MQFFQPLRSLGSLTGRSLLAVGVANLLLPNAAIGLSQTASLKPESFRPMQLAQTWVQLSPSGLSITVGSDEDAVYEYRDSNSRDRADSYYIDGRWYTPNSGYYDPYNQYNQYDPYNQYDNWRDRPTIIRGDIEDSTIVNPIIINSDIDDSTIIETRPNYRYDYTPSSNRTSPTCRVLSHRRTACQ
jgi:hypothetical protein